MSTANPLKKGNPQAPRKLFTPPYRDGRPLGSVLSLLTLKPDGTVVSKNPAPGNRPTEYTSLIPHHHHPHLDHPSYPSGPPSCNHTCKPHSYSTIPHFSPSSPSDESSHRQEFTRDHILTDRLAALTGWDSARGEMLESWFLLGVGVIVLVVFAAVVVLFGGSGEGRGGMPGLGERLPEEDFTGLGAGKKVVVSSWLLGLNE